MELKAASFSVNFESGYFLAGRDGANVFDNRFMLPSDINTNLSTTPCFNEHYCTKVW